MGSSRSLSSCNGSWVKKAFDIVYRFDINHHSVCRNLTAETPKQRRVNFTSNDIWLSLRQMSLIGCTSVKCRKCQQEATPGHKVAFIVIKSLVWECLLSDKICRVKRLKLSLRNEMEYKVNFNIVKHRLFTCYWNPLNFKDMQGRIDWLLAVRVGIGFSYMSVSSGAQFQNADRSRYFFVMENEEKKLFNVACRN